MTGSAGAASVASGVVGLVLLMRSTGGAAGSDPRLGIGYALLSAAGYAGVTLLRRASGRKRAGGEFEATVAGFAVGTFCFLPWLCWRACCLAGSMWPGPWG